MFKTKEMSKVLVFGSKRDMPKVISVLHKLNVYHIVEHEANEIDIGNPLESSEEISEMFVKARSLASSWNLEKNDYAPSSNHLKLKPTIKKVDEIHSKNAELQKNIKKVKEEINHLNELKNNLYILKKFKINPSHIDGLKSVVCILGSVKSTEGIDDAIKSITSDYELSTDIDSKTKKISIALIIERKFEEEAIKSLQSFSFMPLDTQSLSTLKGDISKNLSQISDNIKKLEKEKSSLEKEAKQLRYDNAKFIYYADKLFSKESDKAEAPLKFAVSNNLFFIKGIIDPF